MKCPETPPYFSLKSQILRQPVGVLLIHRKKLSPTLTTSTFPAIILKMRLTQLPKLLLFQSFRFFFRFPLTNHFIKSYSIFRLTEQNLENQIYKPFQPRAVTMTLNPYQGLKLKRKFLWLREFWSQWHLIPIRDWNSYQQAVRVAGWPRMVTMTLNPYQGLKLLTLQIMLGAIDVTMTLNPYQGLKQAGILTAKKTCYGHNDT